MRARPQRQPHQHHELGPAAHCGVVHALDKILILAVRRLRLDHGQQPLLVGAVRGKHHKLPVHRRVRAHDEPLAPGKPIARLGPPHVLRKCRAQLAEPRIVLGVIRADPEQSAGLQVLVLVHLAPVLRGHHVQILEDPHVLAHKHGARHCPLHASQTGLLSTGRGSPLATLAFYFSRASPPRHPPRHHVSSN